MPYNYGNPKKTRSGKIGQNVERRPDLSRKTQSKIFKDVNKLAIKIRKQSKRDEFLDIENLILTSIIATEIDSGIDVKHEFLEDLHSGDLANDLAKCAIELGLPTCLSKQMDKLVLRERKRRERKSSIN